VAHDGGIRYIWKKPRVSDRRRSLIALSVTVDSVLVQDKEPTAAALDGAAVVLSVRAGAYFGFNPVATEIWDMLAEPCRVGEIFERLADTHEVDAATLSRDVTPFLQTLIENRLVRLVDPGGAR
jgi:hypothetical protein